ncbi:type II toxin-antitoxin system VapC family toxin [Brunnivagina elsteri]|uniref:Ribonuclease VapC n=1 Tax=Brunnivagina elsteri CCALA 953 TaxID=987040 RepID=A0A2A2TEA2_9CYAN|nr:type II toxin-antitoxin system VapC family toxin [Calothrix elsteri]PAX51976.1 VapC toxin family PIN domain ribonuclease [Calothrix elsteri CCALA 953]
MIYLDTSIVAPLYWTETLSDTVEELVLSETELGLSQLVEVELISALSRRVRMREISSYDATAIVERFQIDIDSGFYTRITLETIHYHLAREWISRFATPLRTLDALHLAVASQNNVRLLTADAGLAASAQFLEVDVLLLE